VPMAPIGKSDEGTAATQGTCFNSRRLST
jgi:hypothetical protein